MTRCWFLLHTGAPEIKADKQPRPRGRKRKKGFIGTPKHLVLERAACPHAANCDDCGQCLQCTDGNSECADLHTRRKSAKTAEKTPCCKHNTRCSSCGACPVHELCDCTHPTCLLCRTKHVPGLEHCSNASTAPRRSARAAARPSTPHAQSEPEPGGTAFSGPATPPGAPISTKMGLKAVVRQLGLGAAELRTVLGNIDRLPAETSWSKLTLGEQERRQQSRFRTIVVDIAMAVAQALLPSDATALASSAGGSLSGRPEHCPKCDTHEKAVQDIVMFCVAVSRQHLMRMLRVVCMCMCDSARDTGCVAGVLAPLPWNTSVGLTATLLLPFECRFAAGHGQV